MSAVIYPVVLCGGMGSRLWPMSRMEQPKQFQSVSGKGSLTYFQTTLQRHRGAAFHDPIIVTSIGQTALVHRQLRDLQLHGTVIAEPMGRNTGPAVLAAALNALRHDPDAQMLILPSDHVITGDLNTTVLAMRKAADDGRIVLFGVPPLYPETGYGYIMDGGAYSTYPGLHRIEKFIEKPPFELATSLFTSGFSYWASGISLFRADVIVEEFRRFEPATFTAVSTALAEVIREDHALILEPNAFAQAKAEPTERLIFERSAAVALAPALQIAWDDVGAWSAVHKISTRDEAGNVLLGDVLAMNTRNSLVQSDTRLVAVIGMHDIVVVDTPDALLVMNRESSQNVKQVVDELKARKRPEVNSHVVRQTHWGQVETLARERGYDMRMLVVTPGATVRVNGTGEGPSLLTFIAGDGSYHHDGQLRAAVRGDSVTIQSDVILPVTNTGAQDLRLIQLMLTDDGDPAALAGAVKTIAPMFPNPLPDPAALPTPAYTATTGATS